jgi:hypothetical protein
VLKEGDTPPPLVQVHIRTPNLENSIMPESKQAPAADPYVPGRSDAINSQWLMRELFPRFLALSASDLEREVFLAVLLLQQRAKRHSPQKFASTYEVKRLLPSRTKNAVRAALCRLRERNVLTSWENGEHHWYEMELDFAAWTGYRMPELQAAGLEQFAAKLKPEQIARPPAPRQRFMAAGSQLYDEEQQEPEPELPPAPAALPIQESAAPPNQIPAKSAPPDSGALSLSGHVLRHCGPVVIDGVVQRHGADPLPGEQSAPQPRGFYVMRPKPVQVPTTPRPRLASFKVRRRQKHRRRSGERKRNNQRRDKAVKRPSPNLVPAIDPVLPAASATPSTNADASAVPSPFEPLAMAHQVDAAPSNEVQAPAVS